jgi:hypothetical protein
MEEPVSETDTQDTSNQDGNDTSDKTSGAGDEFQAITSQEELNKVIGERIKRAEAKYGDYADLQAKAAKLDKIEKANQSEAERLAEEVSTAKAEAESARAELLRYRVATEHGITDADDISLFLTGTDEETLTKQAQRLAARSEEAGKPRSPRPDKNQGRPSGGSASTADQFAAALGGSL